MGCVDLKIFPKKLEMFSLKMLFLSDCSNIKRLPNFGKNMTCITELNLLNCKNLISLPNSISNLKSLRILNISGCSKICNLPDGINQIMALEDIDLSRTAIRDLDPSLLQLGNLKRLSLRSCRDPATNSSWNFHLPFGKKFSFFPAQTTNLTLPPFLSGLSSLTELDLSDCNLTDSSIPHDIDCLSSLERLILSGNNFVCLPTHHLANLSKLHYLELEDFPQLQSLPILPPHVRMYVTDSDAKEANAVDPQKIWKVFESSEKEFLVTCTSSMFDFLYPMYFKIPSRFDNQNFFPLSSSYVSKLDSVALVTVDIPDDCLSSDWWGVAVFVALEAEVPQDSKEATKGFLLRFMRLYWNFDTLGPEDGPSLSLSAGSTAYNDLYLITMVVSGDFIYIRRHRRGDRKSMQESFSKHRKPEFTENSSLRFEMRVTGCKIRKCGWRMLRKEEYLEDLQMLNSSGLVVAPSNSGHSAGMEKSSVDESNGKDTTALDVLNIERSNENFSLGKIFHNIRKGLGLSVLALISVMVGVTVFRSPMHDLRFKKPTTTIETITNTILKSHWISSNDIVLKVNTLQLQHIHRNRNVRQRLPCPTYQPPRRLSLSQNHFCLTR
ncbi:putative leucine-rich repeat domain, L domain-containing protein [Medicago truncatula]|uniref:Putative leucine-rich repeat domain, L domain-containing protein n=1 Tax=Medicago truncatula TaxID=3880 RepID=A0A396ITB8_MEDTR|nr:putative leucine-rich repeat domain, L domain-containing protein [Medicago truncatula]